MLERLLLERSLRIVVLDPVPAAWT